MNISKSKIALAVAGVMALGAAGQAQAGVYAGSRLLVEDLSVSITPLGTVALSNWSFSTAASAELNVVNTASDPRTCSTIGTACSAVAPVLQSTANAPTGAPVRAAGDFSFFGPGMGQTFSNAASEIGEAELATGNLTTTGQISEVELAGAGVGESRTTVSSNTTFVLNFDVVDGPATFVLAFMADPNLYVAVDTANLFAALATATVSANFELTGSNGTSIQWAPDGRTGGGVDEFDDCVGATCTENSDASNLNVSRSLPPGNPSSNGFNDDRFATSPDTGWGAFGITLNNLRVGSYTLSLTATTFTRAEQSITQVPEPASLALLGLGLAGLGLTRYRRKQA